MGSASRFSGRSFGDVLPTMSRSTPRDLQTRSFDSRIVPSVVRTCVGCLFDELAVSRFAHAEALLGFLRAVMSRQMQSKALPPW